MADHHPSAAEVIAKGLMGYRNGDPPPPHVPLHGVIVHMSIGHILDKLSAAGLAVVPVGEPPPWMARARPNTIHGSAWAWMSPVEHMVFVHGEGDTEPMSGGRPLFVITEGESADGAWAASGS